MFYKGKSKSVKARKSKNAASVGEDCLDDRTMDDVLDNTDALLDNVEEMLDSIDSQLFDSDAGKVLNFLLLKNANFIYLHVSFSQVFTILLDM